MYYRCTFKAHLVELIVILEDHHVGMVEAARGITFIEQSQEILQDALCLYTANRVERIRLIHSLYSMIENVCNAFATETLAAFGACPEERGDVSCGQLSDLKSKVQITPKKKKRILHNCSTIEHMHPESMWFSPCSQRPA